MADSIADQWLGKGVRFPLRPDPTMGGLSYIDSMELVRQSIETILDTEPGERIMLPGSGAGCGATSGPQRSATTVQSAPEFFSHT